MVVLDTNYGSGMLSNTNYEDRYLTPDPITVPPTLDAKNSPLALLAQTCSQIGADSSATKPLLSSLERKKSSPTNSTLLSTERSPSSGITSGTSKPCSDSKSPEGAKLAFKPYELNVLPRKSDVTAPTRLPLTNNGTIIANTVTPVTTAIEYDDRKSISRTSSRKSASSSPHTATTPNDKRSLSSPHSASSFTSSDVKPQTPVDINSVAKLSPPNDVYTSLKESVASFKSPFSLLSSPNGFGCNGCPTLPPGFDPTNPAFRNSFVASGAAAHLPHPAALLDAAACFQSSAAVPSPYMYSRVKTPTGAETIMPVCKDPFCFGCRFTLHGSMGPCPPGCVQCDQKYNAAAAAMLMNPFSGAAAYQYGRSLVCNWVSSGEQYCGKRFRTSDELLQHLRTHSNGSDPVALMNHLRYSSAAAAAAINPLVAASTAAAARYHPYSKPGALPPSLAASPFSAFNPALSPYYPPYPLYDQRIGAAVNP